MGTAPAIPGEPPRAAESEMTSLPALARFILGASGRLLGLRSNTSRGHGPCWASGLRAYRGRRPGGDLWRPSNRDGVGRGALCTQPRNIPSDRDGRAHPALRAQRQTEVQAHAAQPLNQRIVRPDRQVPHLHAALLQTPVEEPRRQWPETRRL